MKHLSIFIACFLLFSTPFFAQTSEKYNALIKEAWKLYQTNTYLASAQKYAEAFASNDQTAKSSDRYNAACSWAMAGDKETAFEQLFKIARESNYTQYDHFTVDSDLNLLHSDPRWQELCTLVKANKEKAEASFDKPLVAILDSIYRSDQQYRMQIADIEKKYGRQSEQMTAHWRLISQTDSINLINITNILDTRGWLSASLIGAQGNTTLFLVIQHADLAIQEKYLPMMRDAVQKGNANAGNLALLEDRVALRKGNRQIYGSQIGQDAETGTYYVSPLEDPDHVDQRREKVGLGPLADYVLRWKITWDVEAYKNQLPELEAKRKH
jgi:hypothetical protein